jgi:hypothetical protein
MSDVKLVGANLKDRILWDNRSEVLAFKIAKKCKGRKQCAERVITAATSTGGWTICVGGTGGVTA